MKETLVVVEADTVFLCSADIMVNHVLMKLYYEAARLHNLTSTYWSFDFGRFGSNFAITNP